MAQPRRLNPTISSRKAANKNVTRQNIYIAELGTLLLLNYSITEQVIEFGPKIHTGTFRSVVAQFQSGE